MINLTKSQPAPACLAAEKQKADGDCKCEDVLERIHKDFYNKCYICEEKAPSSINVEHFRPHRKNKDLKFDWNNLFFACSHCNNTKQAYEKFDDILNCTDYASIITECIDFEINPFPKERPKITPILDTPQIQSTVQLLREIYNGTTMLKTMESVNIREKLLTEIRDFQDILFPYFEPGLTFQKKEDIKTKIRRSVQPESAFTAFKIWIIKRNPALHREFGDILPVFQPPSDYCI